MNDRLSLLDRTLSRLFGLLLFLLPPPFRRRFGPDVGGALDRTLRERGSTVGKLSAFARVASDLLATLIPEWIDWARGEPVPESGPAGPLSRGVGGRSLGSGSVAQDTRFALRVLRRRPLFSALTMATLGLSIGAATAMFSVVNGVLLRPLPYRDPGQLVEVWQVFPQWREREGLNQFWQSLGVSYAQFQDWKRDQSVFESVAVFYTSESSQMALSGDGPARMLSVGVASATLLPTLGVEPVLGRGFLPEEEAPSGSGSSRVALLSHEFWTGHFGSDPQVLEESLILDGEVFSVVGVLPPGFRLRSMGGFHGRDTRGAQDVWILPGAGPVTTSRSSNIYDAVGRLRPGVPLAAAEADVQASMFQGTSESSRAARIVRRTEEELRGLHPPLLLLLGATGLLLLIGCANTATLFLTELSSRSRDLATRSALGAGRFRVFRQLLTESMLLGSLGGLVGVAVAWAGTRALSALAPPIPRLHEIGVDPRVLAFAVGTGMLTGILFGTLPALLSVRGRLSTFSTRASGGGNRKAGQLQRGLLGFQIALTVVLLVTGGLLSRSLFLLRSTDPGFRGEDLATIRVSLPDALFPGSGATPGDSGQVVEPSDLRSARGELTRSLLQRLQGLPGVTRVSAADGLPFPAGRVSGSTVRIVGREGPGSRLDPNRYRVWPGFHEVMGIPLVAGRGFTEADMAEPNGVTLISESFARRYWPNGSPLGEVLRYGMEGETQTIVGVVGDVRAETLDADVRPTFYVLLGRYTPATVSLLARGPGDSRTTAASMRRAIQEMNPAIPVSEEGGVAELVAWSAREEEYRTLLMGVFAALATLLAGVGIFGVTARGVTHRAREMGIRIAVGAEHTNLVQDIMRGAVATGIPGILVGLAGAFLASQLLAGFLFGVSAADPITYGMVSAFAMVLCALASYLPARRIARIDPAEVLKEE